MNSINRNNDCTNTNIIYLSFAMLPCHHSWKSCHCEIAAWNYNCIQLRPYYVSSRLMAFPSNCTNREVVPSLLRTLCDNNRLVVDNAAISRRCSTHKDKTMCKRYHREHVYLSNQFAIDKNFVFT